MIPVNAWAIHDARGTAAAWAFERRDVGADDVRIAIDFCGICHSDVHFAHGDWGAVEYPVVPGHEIVGRVVECGSGVTDLAPGDTVAVGCLVDSCRACASCGAGLEQYCDRGWTGTYGGVEKETGRQTYGGYASGIVVNRHFVLRLPATLDPAGAAPLLCAGITTYSPLRHWHVGPGTRVGVVGLGGLGHMAVKLAAAMGAEVTMFTTTPAKARDAERLGASRVVLSRDASQLRAAAHSLDLILDTVSAPHDLAPYLETLYRDGTHVLLGADARPFPGVSPFALMMRRRSIGASLIGGIAETQEMLDFCATHAIVADVEVVSPSGVEEAWRRMLASDVKYRFVIDLRALG